MQILGGKLGLILDIGPMRQVGDDIKRVSSCTGGREWSQEGRNPQAVLSSAAGKPQKEAG